MRAMQEAAGRFWWVGKLMIHAVIAGVVLFVDGGLGVAIGATVAGAITAVAVHNWRNMPNG